MNGYSRTDASAHRKKMQQFFLRDHCDERHIIIYIIETSLIAQFILCSCSLVCQFEQLDGSAIPNRGLFEAYPEGTAATNSLRTVEAVFGNPRVHWKPQWINFYNMRSFRAEVSRSHALCGYFRVYGSVSSPGCGDPEKSHQ